MVSPTMRWVVLVLCGAVVAALLTLSGNERPARNGDGMPEASRPAAASPPVTSPPLEAGGYLPGANTDQPPSGDPAPDRPFDCSPYPDDVPTEDDLIASAERYRLESERRARMLEDSEDADLRLAAALLTDTRSPAYLQRLLSALALDPDNPLVLERLLDACINRPESRVCEQRGIVDRAAEADGSNGAMWGAIAGYHASRGDGDRALEALRRAASMGVHREYLIDFVGVMDLGLAAVASDQAFGDRVIDAMGRAVGFRLPWLTAYNECRDRVEEDPLWRDGCLDFARHLEARSLTQLSRGIGIGMQAMIAETTRDEAALAAAKERRDSFAAWQNEYRTSDGELVLTRDERVLRAFIDEWRAHGEFAALAYVRQEVDRLKRVPGYDPCASEPLAR